MDWLFPNWVNKEPGVSRTYHVIFDNLEKKSGGHGKKFKLVKLFLDKIDLKGLCSSRIKGRVEKRTC